MLWPYRTTSQTSIGETLFSLAYGVEAMIPVEVGVPSLRRETYNQEENFALEQYELDLLEEKRDLAYLRIASYKRRSERYFNSKVKKRRFKETLHYPNWKGPKKLMLESSGQTRRDHTLSKGWYNLEPTS